MDTQRFEDWTAYRATLLSMLAQSPSRLDWLDDDLSQTGIGSLAAVEQLKGFLLGQGGGKLRLLLRDPAWFQVHCPRTMQLFETWGHRVEMRLCTEEDQPVDERFLLGNATVVRRFHPDAARGEWTESGQMRALCQQRFDALWHGAEPISISRPLGL